MPSAAPTSSELEIDQVDQLVLAHGEQAISRENGRRGGNPCAREKASVKTLDKSPRYDCCILACVPMSFSAPKPVTLDIIF
jgi:hypothetical protein